MKQYIILLLILFGAKLSMAQLSKLTLAETIHLARENSLDAAKAENLKENKYWQYKSFVATTLPHLSASGALPDYNKSINQVIQPDGTTEFRNSSMMTSDVALSLSQNIPLTGGSVSVSSNLQRIDILEGSNEGVSYATSPVYVSFSQPLFTFNSFKWNKKLQPMQFEESKKEFAEAFEQISYRATNYYFNLLLAQMNFDIAKINLANNDTIFKIGTGRYNLGKIAENELLQLELNVISSKRDLAQAEIDREEAQLNLNTYIGRPAGEALDLIIPDDVLLVAVDTDVALEQAKQNRKQYLMFKRQLLEAERDIAQAKGNSSLNVNLTGSYGLSQQAEDISDVYQDYESQQRFRLGFNIPIVDWSQRKAERLTAQANQDLVKNTVAQEQMVFEQEIYVLAKKLPITYDRVLSTCKADEVASRQYEISRQRYLVANISVTDLNLSLSEKDGAKRSYISALKDYWSSYYQLRMLTMYDFVENAPIVSSEIVNK